VALALGVPGEAVMGLGGPAFVAGTGALAALLLPPLSAAAQVRAQPHTLKGRSSGAPPSVRLNRFSAHPSPSL
jgi:hypothetical protein